MSFLAPARFLGCVFLCGATAFVACGGKTADPDLDSGSGTPPTPSTTPTEAGPPPIVDAGGRTCPSECTVGHQCCKGSCGGLPVPMPSSCCSCLPGEVDSLTCGNTGKCGG